jgi:hypothetical protein
VGSGVNRHLLRKNLESRTLTRGYLCVRGGELKALTWSKIDLERGVVIGGLGLKRTSDSPKSRWSINPA